MLSLFGIEISVICVVTKIMYQDSFLQFSAITLYGDKYFSNCVGEVIVWVAMLLYRAILYF